MPINGTYYLGRILKAGRLTSDSLKDSILAPTSILRGNTGWTIIDPEDHPKFILGTLVKFKSTAAVPSLDLERHSEILKDQPNLIITKSPFVYLPEFSGICFLKVTNHIEPKQFARYFTNLIKEKFENLFVDCEIDWITDLRSFVIKMRKLDGIYKIDASIKPPNPLFGAHWKSLKDYLESRNTDSMKIIEETQKNSTLNTLLVQIIDNLTDSNIEPDFKNEIPIGDAAILMAADGYGKGVIDGRTGSMYVTISTDQTIRNFKFDKIPDPEALYQKAKEILDEISKERYMKHD